MAVSTPDSIWPHKNLTCTRQLLFNNQRGGHLSGGWQELLFVFSFVSLGSSHIRKAVFSSFPFKYFEPLFEPLFFSFPSEELLFYSILSCSTDRTCFPQWSITPRGPHINSDDLSEVCLPQCCRNHNLDEARRTAWPLWSGEAVNVCCPGVLPTFKVCIVNKLEGGGVT